MFHLLQVAAQNTSDSISSHMSAIAYGLLLALNLWVARTTQQTRELVRSMHQWAFGPQGANGADSTLKEHASAINDHETRITVGEGRVSAIELREERRHGPPDRRHP